MQQRGRGLGAQYVPRARLLRGVTLGHRGERSGPSLGGFPGSAAGLRCRGGEPFTARLRLSSCCGPQIRGSGLIPEIMSGTCGAAADKSFSEVEIRSQRQYGKYEFLFCLQIETGIIINIIIMIVPP